MGKKLAQTKPDRKAQSRGDGGEGKTNLFTKSILTGDVAPNMRWRGKGRVVYQTGREGNGRPGGGGVQGNFNVGLRGVYSGRLQEKTFTFEYGSVNEVLMYGEGCCRRLGKGV